ncbi:MAG: Na+/H+ antiporter NhaA [Bacteroidota bacterium]
MPAKVLKRNFLDYLKEFMHDSKSIGIVLLACTIASLIVANLPFGTSYIQFFEKESSFLHSLRLPHSIAHFTNDGLMAVFFFLVGLEIKREFTSGELSSFSKAVLPFGAALGGMLVPAFIFILFNRGTIYEEGWGIPMATDIAFSLGVAAILGRKFPVALKIFLMALAIIDDLGAILVIAFFYGGSISGYWLLAAAVCIALLSLLNKRKSAFGWMNIVLGVVLWYCVYNSGIHATIAGVVFAFMVPKKDLTELEHSIHNVVNFGILPLFALVNTAIIINSSLLGELGTTVSIGIFCGLFFGKPIGVLLACWILVQHKAVSLPEGTTWGQLAGAGILAGIGFTMSIFISALAFEQKNVIELAKIVVLISAILSIIAVLIWMGIVARYNNKQPKIIDMEAEDEYSNLA